MIGGMARMGKWFIDSGMRRGTPKADQENVITVYGGTDAWKQRVGFGDPKAAYLILDRPERQGRLAMLGRSRRRAIQDAFIGGVEATSQAMRWLL